MAVKGIAKDLGLDDVIHPSLVFELFGVFPAELGLADRFGQLEEYEFLFGKPRLNLPFYLFFGCPDFPLKPKIGPGKRDRKA